MPFQSVYLILSPFNSSVWANSLLQYRILLYKIDAIVYFFVSYIYFYDIYLSVLEKRFSVFFPLPQDENMGIRKKGGFHFLYKNVIFVVVKSMASP